MAPPIVLKLWTSVVLIAYLYLILSTRALDAVRDYDSIRWKHYGAIFTALLCPDLRWGAGLAAVPALGIGMQMYR